MDAGLVYQLSKYFQVLVVWLRIPSSNKNIANTASDKRFCLLFANEANSVLNLKPALKSIFWYRCVAGGNQSKDLCDRAAGTGIHPISGYMVITCRK